MANRRSTYLGGVISFRLNEIGVVPIIEHPTAKDKKTVRPGNWLLPQNQIILKSAAARGPVYFSNPTFQSYLSHGVPITYHTHMHHTYHTHTPHTHITHTYIHTPTSYTHTTTYQTHTPSTHTYTAPHHTLNTTTYHTHTPHIHTYTPPHHTHIPPHTTHTHTHTPIYHTLHTTSPL